LLATVTAGRAHEKRLPRSMGARSNTVNDATAHA
jgi:hypothetical protein